MASQLLEQMVSPSKLRVVAVAAYEVSCASKVAPNVRKKADGIEYVRVATFKQVRHCSVVFRSFGMK